MSNAGRIGFIPRQPDESPGIVALFEMLVVLDRSEDGTRYDHVGTSVVCKACGFAGISACGGCDVAQKALRHLVDCPGVRT